MRKKGLKLYNSNCIIYIERERDRKTDRERDSGKETEIKYSKIYRTVNPRTQDYN